MAPPATADSGDHLHAWYDSVAMAVTGSPYGCCSAKLNASGRRAPIRISRTPHSPTSCAPARRFRRNAGPRPQRPPCRSSIGRLGARADRQFRSRSAAALRLSWSRAISDGPQPLPACRYYVRLAQRLIAALSCNFGEGPLFAVDFRLRPWGRKGRCATNRQPATISPSEAWTFEAMALTRARVVTAAPGRTRKWMPGRRRDERGGPARGHSAGAAAMRRMVQREKATRRVWDVKCVPAG